MLKCMKRITLLSVILIVLLLTFSVIIFLYSHIYPNLVLLFNFWGLLLPIIILLISYIKRLEEEQERLLALKRRIFFIIEYLINHWSEFQQTNFDNIKQKQKVSTYISELQSFGIKYLTRLKIGFKGLTLERMIINNRYKIGQFGIMDRKINITGNEKEIDNLRCEINNLYDKALFWLSSVRSK